MQMSRTFCNMKNFSLIEIGLQIIKSSVSKLQNDVISVAEESSV